MAAPSARERLASCIATLAEVRTEIERLERASPNAMHANWDADAAITQAEAALAETEHAAMEHRVLALAGDAVEPPPDIAAARARLATAREDAATAGAVRKQIDARLRKLLDDLPSRQASVEGAARSVLRAEAGAAAKVLAKQLAPLQEQVADIGGALAWLLFEGVDMDAETRAIGRRFDEPPASWRLPSAAKQRWGDALDRLKADPAAVVPKT